MADFSNYDLADLHFSSRGVYDLADGLVPEMAQAMDYELTERPTIPNLEGFAGHFAPKKTLQDNIAATQELLGPDAITIATEWMDRSGALKAVSRSFGTEDIAVPKKVDYAMLSGGVARWMLRRAEVLRAWAEAGNELKKFVVMPLGNRLMGLAEHELVAEYENREGHRPVEFEFAEAYVEPLLREAGLRPELLKLHLTRGDQLLGIAFNDERNPNLVKGTVLVATNAPTSTFTAGQIRQAAIDANPGFDRFGDQLFVVGDSFPLARTPEELSSTATHQHPISALGSLARNALELHRASQ